MGALEVVHLTTHELRHGLGIVDQVIKTDLVSPKPPDFLVVVAENQFPKELLKIARAAAV